MFRKKEMLIDTFQLSAAQSTTNSLSLSYLAFVFSSSVLTSMSVCEQPMEICGIFISAIFVTSFGWAELFCRSPKPSSPNVGEAPHAMRLSSAEITTDVQPHPMSVIFQPVSVQRERELNHQSEGGFSRLLQHSPARSWTGFGYMLASPVFLFCPNKKS